jgi:alkyl hydroperoxide reductase subunit F
MLYSPHSSMFDVLIVGGGPAALAGAVYLARQKHSFALIAPTIGGQVSWSSDVENYLGFHLLDGVELVKRFRAHLEDYQQAFVLKEGETVTTLEKTDTGFRATTATGQTYDGKTVLLAGLSLPSNLLSWQACDRPPSRAGRHGERSLSPRRRSPREAGARRR